MSARMACHQGEPMTHAMRLMLLSCVSECSAGQIAELREMAKGFAQWDFFSRLVVKNRVFPTVFRNLKRLSDDVEGETLCLLQAKCEGNRLVAMKLMAELIRITRQFDRAGIRAISLKGPALGLELYGDLSLRASKDLDLLVNPKDVDAAEHVLQSMGYQRSALIAAVTPRQRRYLLNKDHHFNYVNGTGVEVELHWRYDVDFHVDFNDLWASRKRLTAFGEYIDLPGDEENFLYLLHHGSRHGWKRLRWLLDVREIARKDELDWTVVRDRARALGMTSILEQAFCLLDLLFGLELPQGLEGLRIDHPGALAQTRLAVALISSADESCGSLHHEHYLSFKEYSLGMQRTPSSKLRFLLSQF